MNIVIMIFVILSTIFVASSINNLGVCLNGVAEFLDFSGVGDYTFLIYQNADYDVNGSDITKEYLDKNPYVDSYQEDYSLNTTDANYKKEDGSSTHFNNTFFLVGDRICHKLFDENNEEIKNVRSGEVYLPRSFLENNGLKKGDSIIIKLDSGFQKKFKIKGILKDAFLGSSMMGNKRTLISQEDYELFANEKELSMCQIFSVWTSNLDELKQDINKNKEINLLFGADHSLLKITYVMDTVIALVLLMVGICLVVISAIMLRFTVVFTVKEDYKEIGIMKAIGLPDRSIRKLYAVKYFVIAVLGAVIGFGVSIPFSNVLLESVTQTIVLKKIGSGIWVELMTAVIIATVVTLYAYRSTKSIKKMTPMDAIRSGNNGERFKRKNLISLKKSRMSSTMFMAVSDVLAEWKKYVILLITSILGVWLAVMPVNTINTLRSDELGTLFGQLTSDYVISNEGVTIELISQADEQVLLDYMDDMEKQLRDGGVDVERVVLEVLLRYSVRKGERSYSTVVNHGLHTQTSEYVYEEGVAPVLDNEVAITYVVADEIDAKIGDTIYVMNGDVEKPYLVTGIFQSMNNQGQGLRFGQEETVDYRGIMGTFGFQVFLKETPEKEEYQETLEKIKELYPDSKVMTMSEFLDENMGGIAGQLESLKYIVLVIVIIINFLVVILMQKMFVIREEGEMGMLKAVGFTNSSIIHWQTKRIFMVLMLGIVIGTATGTIFSQFTSGFVFQFMGAHRITFVINPLEVYCIYPLLIVVMTILGCVLATGKVKKINVQNMNQME